MGLISDTCMAHAIIHSTGSAMGYMHGAFERCLHASFSHLLLQAGFLDKNNDALHASLEQMVAVSKDPFIKKLFPEAATPTYGVNTKKLALVSIGSKFKVCVSRACACIQFVCVSY